MLRSVVVMDYQNVHLTARDLFDPAGETYNSLIHPMKFAEAAIRQRNQIQRPGYPHAELVKVITFRGLPHADYDWEQNRRCLDQATQWRKDGAEVRLRDLKYQFERDASGSPIKDVYGKKMPKGKPQEKGVDVLCALECFSQAIDPEVDLVLLASRDTDLVPVLDRVFDLRKEDKKVASIETLSWYNYQAKKEGKYPGSQLRASDGRRIWNTNLDATIYHAALDRNDYR